MEASAGSKSNEMPSSPEEVSPQVTIIEDGQVINDPNRIRPDVIQFITQMKMARDITRIKNIIEDQESQGEMSAFNPTISSETEIDLPWPCQSLSIINLNAPVILCWLNNKSHYAHRLRQNVPLNINFWGHKLDTIFLDVEVPGTTASLEIIVKY